MKRFPQPFLEEDSGGGGAPPVVVPAAAPVPELVQPVVDHSAKIATLEERQGQQEMKLLEQIGVVRDDLFRAVEDSKTGTSDRITALEEKLSALMDKLTQQTPPAPEPAAPAPAAPVVKVETPPVTKRTIRRNGRKITRNV